MSIKDANNNRIICMFPLIYNQTFITDPDDNNIVNGYEQSILKVTNINCHLERGKEYKICLVYKNRESCNVLIPE